MRIFRLRNLSVSCIIALTAAQATAFESATLHGTPDFSAAAYSPTGDQLFAEYKSWILSVDADYRDDAATALRRFTPIAIPETPTDYNDTVRSIHVIDSASVLRLGNDAVIIRAGAEPETFFVPPMGEILSAGAFSPDHNLFALVTRNTTSQLLTYRLFSGDLSSNEPILELETETMGVPEVTPFFVPESNNLLFPISIDKVQEVSSDGTIVSDFTLPLDNSKAYNSALWLSPAGNLLGSYAQGTLTSPLYIIQSSITDAESGSEIVGSQVMNGISGFDMMAPKSNVTATGRYTSTQEGMIRWNDDGTFDRMPAIPTSLAINEDPAVVYTGTEEWSFAGERIDFDVLKDSVHSINSVSDDGRYFQLIGKGRVAVWDSENYELNTVREYPETFERTFMFGRNFDLGVLLDQTGTFIFDEAESLDPIASYEYFAPLAHRDLSTDENARGLVVLQKDFYNGQGGDLLLLEIKNGAITETELSFSGVPGGLYVSYIMAISEDGTKILAKPNFQFSGNTVLSYDIPSATTTVSGLDRNLTINRNFFTPNGRFFVTQDDHTISVFETENFIEVNRWQPLNGTEEDPGFWLNQVGANNELFLSTESGVILIDGNTGEELARAGSIMDPTREPIIIKDGFLHAPIDNDSMITLTYQEKSDFNMVEIARLLADRPTPVTEGDLNGDGVVDAGDLILK